MCRMISKLSLNDTSMAEEMLHAPCSLQYLSENGLQPADPSLRGKHNDGCGFAYAKNNKVEIHRRGKKNVWDDAFRNVIETARSRIFIGHARLATEGLEANADGAHPFTVNAGGLDYVLAHNGTVYNFVPEARRRNTSDSQIFLEHLVLQNELNDEEKIISRLVEIAGIAEFSSMTAFLMTPEQLMVWRISDLKDKDRAEKRLAYYTMYMKFSDNCIVFASEPLDNGNWTLMQNNSLVSARPAGDRLDLQYRRLLI